MVPWCVFCKQGDAWLFLSHPLRDKVWLHQYNAQPMATVDPAAPKQPLALPDHILVAATVGARLPFEGQFKALTPLAGDASNRRYFRIELIGRRSSLRRSHAVG